MGDHERRVRDGRHSVQRKHRRGHGRGAAGWRPRHAQAVERGHQGPLPAQPRVEGALPRTLEGWLKPSEMGGTFTISNLGMFGVSSFVSILPPNTGAFMAVAASTPTFVQQPNGMMGMVKQMTVTLTCDHRHIYGADAAKFLKDLAELIENDIDSVLY